jgi:phosphoglycolate phosphatase
MSSRRLLMWDIDFTLMHTGGVGRLAYRAAFLHLAGHELREYPNFAGRTDLDLVRETLARHGVPAPDLDGFLARYAAEMRARAHLIVEHGVLLPGARDVVAALALRRPDVVQTTVTGNIAPVARLKLAAFGLDTALDLDIGAFGTEDVGRAALVRAARRRAEEKYGRFDEVLVIGDTVHDVAAALACEVTAIGVASGGTGAEQLRAAGAHAVLDSLADVAAVVALLAGAATGATTGTTSGASPG